MTIRPAGVQIVNCDNGMHACRVTLTDGTTCLPMWERAWLAPGADPVWLAGLAPRLVLWRTAVRIADAGW